MGDIRDGGPGVFGDAALDVRTLNVKLRFGGVAGKDKIKVVDSAGFLIYSAKALTSPARHFSTWRTKMPRCEVKNGRVKERSQTSWPVTSLNYEPPHVKVVLQGVAALFEGGLNSSHTQMTGTWTQVKSFPMTFDRVNLKNEGKPN